MVKAKEECAVDRLRAMAFAKRRVQLTKQFGPNGIVTLREFPGIEQCKGASFVQSFPSLHIASTLVGNFLVDQKKLPLVAEITSSEFPTRAVIVDGQPSNGLRVLGNEEVVVLLCEFKVPPSCMSALCDAVFDLAERHSFANITCVEGLPSSGTKQANAGLHFITDDQAAHDNLLMMDAEPILAGVVDGPTGGILTRAPYSHIPVIALMVDVDPLDAGAKASIALLRALQTVLGVEVDTAPLEEKASFLDDKVREMVAQEAAAHQHSSSMYS